MTDIRIIVDDTETLRALSAVTDNIPRQLASIVSTTTTRSRSIVAKEVTTELAVKQKDVKKNIQSRRFDRLTAMTTLKKSRRIPLRDFGARQTRAGVSYRISKTKGRRIAGGAFQGPKPGVMFTKYRGRVFQRVGASRLPIRQLYGPSPWGVITKRNRIPALARKIQAEFTKQAERRIQWLKLRQR